MKTSFGFWALILVLVLNCAIWVAVLLRQPKQLPERIVYRTVRDTVEVIDTVVLTKLKTKVVTIKENRIITQDDSLLLSLTKLSE